MIEIFQNVLLIWAIWFMTGPEELFGIPDYITERLGWMAKPVYTCPPCMASLWGTLYYLGACHEITVTDWMLNVHRGACNSITVTGWILHVLCLCGANVLIGHIIPDNE